MGRRRCHLARRRIWLVVVAIWFVVALGSSLLPFGLSSHLACSHCLWLYFLFVAALFSCDLCVPYRAKGSSLSFGSSLLPLSRHHCLWLYFLFVTALFSCDLYTPYRKNTSRCRIIEFADASAHPRSHSAKLAWHQPLDDRGCFATRVWCTRGRVLKPVIWEHGPG